jgi:hypothetical protein
MNDAGRIVVGFDASQVGPDEDARRVLHGYSHFNSIDNILEQRRKMLRSFFGIDRMLRSFGGIDQMAPESSIRSQGLRLARFAGGNLVGTNTAGVYADLAKRIVPESMRLGLPELSRNLAGVGHYPRLQSDALRYGRMFGNIGPSASVSQAVRLQRIASTHSSLWSLHRVQSVRTSALQSLLKSMTAFGPIVVSPDDEDVPLDYHPDLQGWLIPETATASGDAIDVEELRAQIVAIIVSIARDHRTKAVVRGLGNDGRMILIQVAGTVIGTYICYWLTNH